MISILQGIEFIAQYYKIMCSKVYEKEQLQAIKVHIKYPTLTIISKTMIMINTKTTFSIVEG